MNAQCSYINGGVESHSIHYTVYSIQYKSTQYCIVYTVYNINIYYTI